MIYVCVCVCECVHACVLYWQYSTLKMMYIAVSSDINVSDWDDDWFSFYVSDWFRGDNWFVSISVIDLELMMDMFLCRSAASSIFIRKTSFIEMLNQVCKIYIYIYIQLFWSYRQYIHPHVYHIQNIQGVSKQITLAYNHHNHYLIKASDICRVW